jgi:hypothetical protein
MRTNQQDGARQPSTTAGLLAWSRKIGHLAISSGGRPHVHTANATAKPSASHRFDLMSAGQGAYSMIISTFYLPGITVNVRYSAYC